MSQHSVINEASWGLNVPAFKSKSQDVMKDARLVNGSAKIPSSSPSFLQCSERKCNATGTIHTRISSRISNHNIHLLK